MQRLKNGKRRQVPHRKRAKFGGSALIVTVHQLDGLPSLRTQRVMGVFQKALAIAKDRFGCRVLQFSLLGNHVHFMVEAPDEKALGRAMKGLLVRLAKALNKVWGRKGHVFERRFHSVVVSTMRQVHRALRYVLLNARKHGSRIRSPRGRGSRTGGGAGRPSARMSHRSHHRGSRSWSSSCA